MVSVFKQFAAICLFAAVAHASSFICREPGGKRLVEIDGNDISPVDGKIALRIDGENLRDRDDKIVLVVSNDDIRHSVAGVKLATFDGENIRHGPAAEGKVLMNYHHPDLCPTSQDNRVYSIEGDAINKQQLVAGLYLLKPEMFKLSPEETAAQQQAIKQAGEESDKAAAADQVAGSWTVLNSSGIADHLGQGQDHRRPQAGRRLSGRVRFHRRRRADCGRGRGSTRSSAATSFSSPPTAAPRPSPCASTTSPAARSPARGTRTTSTARIKPSAPKC